MNTPDTEWYAKYKEEFGWSDNYWLDDPQIEFFTKLITSRDTYWKERVRNIFNEMSRDVDGLPYSQEVKNPSPLSLGDEMISRDRVQNIINNPDNLK